MPTVKNSKFVPILEAIATRLASTTGLPATSIRWGRRSGSMPSLGASDQDLILVPRGPVPGEEWVSGHGQLLSVVTRILEVRVRTAFGVDNPDSAEAWMLDPEHGHYQLEELVFQALHMFHPQNSAKDFITIEPMRLIPSWESPREMDDPQWGLTVIGFEIKYGLDLPKIKL